MIPLKKIVGKKKYSKVAGHEKNSLLKSVGPKKLPEGQLVTKK